MNPLVPAVLEHMQQKADCTCYAALLEGLTGIWNAAVRAAVVARLRASGLPPDDLLLRLQKLSPTLGFAAGKPQWARAWLADPFTQDALLVQQCVVRLLFALRAHGGGARPPSSIHRSSRTHEKGVRRMAAIPQAYRDLFDKKASPTWRPSGPTARPR